MIIGIGGPSQAGKSTLAYVLKQHLSPSCCVLSQDEFVKEEQDIPMIKDRIDWESPDSIDLPRLLQEIAAAKEKFNHVIVEGIFAFSFPTLNDYYDKAILTEIDKETFWERRKQETRWGKEPDWFLEHVWTAYLDNKQSLPSSYLAIGNDYDLTELLTFLRS